MHFRENTFATAPELQIAPALFSPKTKKRVMTHVCHNCTWAEIPCLVSNICVALLGFSLLLNLSRNPIFQLLYG